MDDDTIPAKQYLENVLESFEEQEGLYGTRGLIFKSEEVYHKNYFDIGWESKNKKIMFIIHTLNFTVSRRFTSSFILIIARLKWPKI